MDLGSFCRGGRRNTGRRIASRHAHNQRAYGYQNHHHAPRLAPTVCEMFWQWHLRQLKVLADVYHIKHYRRKQEDRRDDRNHSETIYLDGRHKTLVVSACKSCCLIIAALERGA
jgi:hypothetical protein